MNIIKSLYTLDRIIVLLTFVGSIILMSITIYYDKKYSQTNDNEAKNKKELFTKLLIGFVITFMITFFIFLVLRKQNKKHYYGIKKFNNFITILDSLLFMEPDQ